MRTVVGTFRTRQEADTALERLLAAGIPRTDLNLMTPDHPETLDRVPTSEAEAPGMGKAIGAVVGGALGAAAGISLPTMTAVLIPGIGPVLAAGTLAATLLGLGGAIGGAVTGGAIEDSLTEGLPKDEVYVYADALRKKRTVLIVVAHDEWEEERAREVLKATSAESLDAARDDWWVGLRDAEREEYHRGGRDFAADERTYRKGFEAAQHTRVEGRSFDDLIESLRERHGDAANEEAFRRGFERGVHYRDAYMKEPQNL